MKTIKKIALWVLAIVVSLVAIVYVLLRFYEDDVVAFAFEKSKEVFTRPVQIDQIDLAFWHTFPNASLHLEKVFIPDVFDTKDTLFSAQDVYLEFNLMDLFRAHYELKELEINEATAKLKYNNSGQDNYHFWKSTEDSSGFDVALEEVLLQEVRFYYRDEQEKAVYDFFTDNSRVAGDLSQAQCELDLESQVLLKQGWSKGTSLWTNQSIEVEAKIKVDYDQKLYQFAQAMLHWGKITAQMDGVIQTLKDPFFDLHVAGDQLDVADIIALLPSETAQSLAPYDPEGIVDLKANYKGTISKGVSPKLDVQLQLNNGSMQAPNREVELQNIQLSAEVVYATDSWHIQLQKSSAALAGGQLNMAGSIRSGKATAVDLYLNANAEAADLRHFFNLDTLEICAGQVQIDVHSEGELKMAPGDSILDFTALHNTGNATWSNGEMKLKNSNRHFTMMNASVKLDNANAHVNGFTGMVNGCDFTVNGSFNNLVPFLIDNQQRLWIDAKLACQLIDFNQLLETENGTNQTYQLSLPKRVDFSFQSYVKKFVFRQFYAHDVSCVAHLQQGRFFIDPLQFNTAGGALKAQLSLDQQATDQYFVNCLAHVQQMDIQELFREFENFDQTFIQDKHLRGKADATVQFQAPVSTALEVQYKDIYSVIDLKISEGQLLELESLQEIAQYMRTNKWIAPFVDEDLFAEKLRVVKFSTLENTIEISDEVIHVPTMDIRSSAMDISISGEHRFNNQINYSLGFNIRDILMLKQKEWQEQDDGLGKQLFIYMRGTTDQPEFGVDREAAKSDRKAEMQQEKENMKALLKEEFGLFKRDNRVGAFQESVAPSQTTTTIEWDGFDQPKATEDQKPLSKKDPVPKAPVPDDTKTKKTPKWLKEKE